MPALPLPFGDAAIPLTKNKKFAIMAVINSRDDAVLATRQSPQKPYPRLLPHEDFLSWPFVRALLFAAICSRVSGFAEWRNTSCRAVTAFWQCGCRGSGE